MSDVLVFIVCMIDGLVLLALSVYLVSSKFIHIYIALLMMLACRPIQIHDIVYINFILYIYS